MLRFASSLVLVTSLVGLSAFRTERPKFGPPVFAFNTTLSHFFFPERHPTFFTVFSEDEPVVDTTSNLRILMLNVCSYDTAYPGKVHRLLQRFLPASTVVDYTEGTASDFAVKALEYDVVVVAYPSGGSVATLKAYGAALIQYAQQGGGVVITGSHEYSVLQQLGLFDLDYGYFCADPSIHEIAPNHPLLSGTHIDYTLKNYAYPLDISDPAFVTVADIKGYPVLGYKPLGSGKVVYLGIEYYYDEAESNQILTNTLRWASKAHGSPAGSHDAWATRRRTKRTEEVLYTGSGVAKVDIFELKIYPNPYMAKGTLDIDLKKPTTVAVEMTDETGQLVSVLLPRKSLSAGLFRLELPNVSPGVYFLKCQMGERSVVKKVVKVSAP